MSDWMEWMEWSGVDTPQTVMTTRAPAVLKIDTIIALGILTTMLTALLTKMLTTQLIIVTTGDGVLFLNQCTFQHTECEFLAYFGQFGLFCRKSMHFVVYFLQT